MERLPIVERAKEALDGVRRRIGDFVLSSLEKFDDALDVSFDFEEDSERLVTPEELALLEEENNIVRGEE